MALPQKGLESFVTKNLDVAFVLVILMVGGIVLSLVAFVVLIIRAARREMCLCAALIKQMEATQQAERKSLNKSLAFASASHDVRASLAGITGLIDMSRDQVAPGSDLDTNLKQMEENTRDLLGKFLQTRSIIFLSSITFQVKTRVLGKFDRYHYMFRLSILL